MRDIRDDEDRSRSRWFETRELLGDGWLYEVRLPSYARLDAWNPEEGVAIEFKAGIPRDGDVIQCHLLMHELNLVGVDNPQMQLWYRSEYRHLVDTLAETFGYAHQNTGMGWIAVRVDALDETGLDQLAEFCREIQDVAGRFTSPALPMNTSICANCGYHDYCHL